MVSEVFKSLDYLNIVKDLWPLIVIVILFLLAGALKTAASKNKTPDLKYVAAPLLTQNEKHAFRILLSFCKEHDLLIFTKVRLIDLAQPKKGAADYATLRNKVIQKHVDFVICDEDVNVKLIIELDDSSHSRPDRRERDQLVDEVLHRVGYKVIHTNGITPELLSKELFPVELDPETKE